MVTLKPGQPTWNMQISRPTLHMFAQVNVTQASYLQSVWLYRCTVFTVVEVHLTWTLAHPDGVQEEPVHYSHGIRVDVGFYI